MAGSRKFTPEMRQMLRARFPGRQAEVLIQIFAALVTDVDGLEAWGATIATKLNTLGAKLNADAGVIDTNYAIDYDTTPLP